MLIPHSERSAVNFHVNSLVLVFGAVLLLAVASGFIYLSSIHLGSTALLEGQRDELESGQASLDAVLAEVQGVLRAAESFDEELLETIQSIGVGQSGNEVPSTVSRGDLASFFDLQSVPDNRAREIQELRNLSDSLAGAVSPLREVRAVVEAQQDLLADIPNFWPVANGEGRVTMEYGPNIHPITGQWYLHKGFDIAAAAGTPVVASASGKVIELGYDPGYGFYVFLRHKYGFRTRYSHLQSILVTEGQDVVQGETIGLLGNTGISTGPHLDFIVMLGTDVVDPSAFLTISNSFARGGIGTR